MKERPILFSAPMVRAILDGRKTQTRRVMKVQPGDVLWRSNGRDWLWLDNDDGPLTEPAPCIRCPYGVPGDRLWVRETWAKPGEVGDSIEYRADNDDPLAGRWRPSIHMPRWASRITLEVTGVRVERLQDISEDDARAEGIREVTKDGVVKKYCVYDLGDHSSTPWDQMPRRAVAAYAALWNDINGKGAFLSNPWVWVVEFRRL